MVEYKADGGRRYKRPLWLIFIPATSQAEAPTPRQAEAIYDERFSIAQPKPRGKSPGRAIGTKLEPRRRFKVYRKAA